jgi:hypothetical protein
MQNAELALFAGGVLFGSAVLKPHAGDHATAAGATPYAAAPGPSVLPEVTVRSKPHPHSSPPAFAAPNVPSAALVALTLIVGASAP